MVDMWRLERHGNTRAGSIPVSGTIFVIMSLIQNQRFFLTSAIDLESGSLKCCLIICSSLCTTVGMIKY